MPYVDEKHQVNVRRREWRISGISKCHVEVFASDLVLNKACFLFSGQFGSSTVTVNAKSLFWGIAYAGSC